MISDQHHAKIAEQRRRGEHHGPLERPNAHSVALPPAETVRQRGVPLNHRIDLPQQLQPQ